MSEKTIEQLEAENAALRAQNRALANPGVPEEIEEMVKEKVAAGLTREQAIEVAKAQIAWDAELAKQEKAAAIAAEKAAKAKAAAEAKS